MGKDETIHTPTNPDDYDSYFKVKNCSPYNLYHLNALYDLCSNTYLDAVIQKTRKCNEHRALCDMVDRYNSPVNLVIISLIDALKSSDNEPK